jgi:hypothetical protein
MINPDAKRDVVVQWGCGSFCLLGLRQRWSEYVADTNFDPIGGGQR